MNPILKVHRLKKRFGDNEVLRGADLTVFPGQVIFIIGPSGGGKSTLLRCINFLETPNSGLIEFEGRKLCFTESDTFHCVSGKDSRAHHVQWLG